MMMSTFQLQERYFQQGMAWTSGGSIRVERARKLGTNNATFKLDLGHVKNHKNHGAVRSAFRAPAVAKPQGTFARAYEDPLLANYVPVYVMLPLGVISKHNILQDSERLERQLKELHAAGVDGVMVDVWWGIVESEGPQQYDWSAYRALFALVQYCNLKLQVIMSFHQCGGNIGDSITIELPKWVLEIGLSNPDIFYTNRTGFRNKECLSLGVDHMPFFHGRTPIEMYSDYMKSFRENMADYLESELMIDIEVGLGPAGELRYPSYSSSAGWKFPGIGEFQCYDKYLRHHFRNAAVRAGHPEYDLPGDAGEWNSTPESTDFFKAQGGNYLTDYGNFFLTWYSSMLLVHGDEILDEANKAFLGCKVKLAAKVAGIHWWYNTDSHAAELTSGYYNLLGRDGYRPIARILSRHDAIFNFTCLEMRNFEQESEDLVTQTGAQELVQQVLSGCWREKVEVAGENALPRYDAAAYDQIVLNARPNGVNRYGPPKLRMYGVTYLRLTDELLQEENFRTFKTFVRRMHANQNYCPNPEQYCHYTAPMERSKPRIPLGVLLGATEAMGKYDWSEETDMRVSEAPPPAPGLLADIVAIILNIFGNKNRQA